MKSPVPDSRPELLFTTGSSIASFATWYESEHDRLVRVLRRLGAGSGQAEDLAAEAFARALERWNRVCAMESPTGWTYQVALNLLRRSARRSGKERGIRAEPVAPVREDETGDVWEVVRTLPTRQRDAVTLHYMLDLPYKVVARAMGISEGTVAATLSSARKELGRQLRTDFEEDVDD